LYKGNNVRYNPYLRYKVRPDSTEDYQELRTKGTKDTSRSHDRNNITVIID